MTWSAKVLAPQLTAIGATETFFDEVVTLNPGELAHCEIEFNPGGTPTSDLQVSVYATLDSTSESWDEQPILRFIIENDPDPNKKSFTVSGVYKFRVGIVASGGSDTDLVGDFNHRTDGVSA